MHTRQKPHHLGHFWDLGVQSLNQVLRDLWIFLVEWHKVLTSKIGLLPTVQCTALENSLPNSQFTFAILYVCLGHSILGLIEFHLASILLDQYLLTSMNYINDAWRSQILVLAVQHPQLKGSSSSSCSFWNPFFSLLQTICSTENKA